MTSICLPHVAQRKPERRDNSVLEISLDLVERCDSCGQPLDYSKGGNGNPVCVNNDCMRYMLPILYSY